MTEPQKARRKPKAPEPPPEPAPSESDVFTCSRCGGWMRYDETLKMFVCGVCPHKQREKPDSAAEPDDLEW